MDIKKTIDAAYRQDYYSGYAGGMNPYIRISGNHQTEAYTSGFKSGRYDYEQMNGHVIHGIPHRIVTKKILEDVLLSGLLGLSVDVDGYTPHQLDILAEWYQSGTEKYDPDESRYLSEILLHLGVQVNEL
jgi:hypothetical protein